nr:hypothetical protein GCM10020241_56160 [Streptoalloteichus tenebrarius]
MIRGPIPFTAISPSCGTIRDAGSNGAKRGPTAPTIPRGHLLAPLTTRARTGAMSRTRSHGSNWASTHSPAAKPGREGRTTSMG